MHTIDIQTIDRINGCMYVCLCWQWKSKNVVGLAQDLE